MKTYWGVEVQLNAFLTSALDGHKIKLHPGIYCMLLAKPMLAHRGGNVPIYTSSHFLAEVSATHSFQRTDMRRGTTNYVTPFP
jgi:hypothetical protein